MLIQCIISICILRIIEDLFYRKILYIFLGSDYINYKVVMVFILVQSKRLTDSVLFFLFLVLGLMAFQREFC